MMISVIIAVRNEKKHIKECIQAIYQQDYKEPYEVIIIDGESTDGTYEELQELQKKYNFTLLKNNKKNAAAGRNIGIQKAKGEYIAFIDADATPYPDWLTKIQETIKKTNPTEIAGVGGPDLLPTETNKIGYMIGITMTSPLARGGKLNPSTQHTLLDKEKYVTHIPTCNICYHKETLKKIGMFDETFIKG
ncbi:MAG: glycosyltransferase, partial [Candidatus Thermoplasmatota archaeon]